jgi:hypothetical protein
MVASAEPPKDSPGPPRNVYDWLSLVKKSVVFLGVPTDLQTPNWMATGFLLLVSNCFHLVTAKHVVVDPDSEKRVDTGLCVFHNLKRGGVVGRPLSLIRDKGLDWVFHENPEVDIAVIPINLELKDDDVMVVPQALFAPITSLDEMMDLVYVSYQPGAEEYGVVSPVLRSGMLCRINTDRTFLLDGSAFPGNSGCPVFVKPAPSRFLRSGVSLGGDPLAFRLVGLIGSYIPYQEVATSKQTGRPRVVFEENTGLSRVWSTDFLSEILASKPFTNQVGRILEERGS